MIVRILICLLFSLNVLSAADLKLPVLRGVDYFKSAMVPASSIAPVSVYVGSTLVPTESPLQTSFATSSVSPSSSTAGQPSSTTTTTTANTTPSDNYNNFDVIWTNQTIILVVVFCSLFLIIVSMLAYIYVNRTIAKAKRDRAFSDWVLSGNSKLNLRTDTNGLNPTSPVNREDRCTSTSLPGTVVGAAIDDLNESAHDWSVTV